MRFQHLLIGALSVFALVLSVAGSPLGDANEPEILAVASFPESNAFGHVVNGEKNKITLNVENKSDKNVTLVNVAGSFRHPETGVLVKNTTSLTYGLLLIQNVKIELQYTFYSEFKPGDYRLHIWLDHSADNEKYRVTAYDSIVTVVEPEGSILDFKLVSTYLIVAGLFGGLAYFAYLSFVPQPKKTRTKKATTEAVSAPIGSVTATGAGGYQEEWIPEHHLRKPKTGRKKSGFASGTSGDELSGGELSSPEDRKRKGKK